LKFSFFFLAGIDEAYVSPELGREQLDHVV
jgi:hypothetical protein